MSDLRSIRAKYKAMRSQKRVRIADVLDLLGQPLTALASGFARTPTVAKYREQ